MSEPIRILQWGMFGAYGGIEMFIMNLYRHVDRSKVQFDFLEAHDMGKLAFEDEILSMGGRIFRVMYPEREKPLTAGYRLRKFLRAHPEIKGVHVHANYRYAFPLLQAKRCGIPIRIIHSHSSAVAKMPNESYKDKVKLWLQKRQLKKLNAASHCFACSTVAGDAMYATLSYRIIPNAIDTSLYALSPNIRARLRNDLDLQEKTVIGFVGRLSDVKNVLFLADIFCEIHKRNAQAFLLIAGEGELGDKMKERLAQRGLSDSVRFLGMRKDVNELYQAMDLFLLPSRFEGLPVVLVETQTAGLLCLVSDRITCEVEITDLLTYLSIEEPPEKWAEIALQKLAETKRRDRSKEVADAGFEIRQMAKEMEAFYLEQVGKAQ